MSACEAALDVVAVVRHMEVDLLRKGPAGRLDGLHVGVLAHRLGAEVGVRTGPVPVALRRLGSQADHDVVVLGDAVQQPAGDVHVVADRQGVGGTDLELPLPGHDFGVGSLDHQPGVDAGLGVLLDDLAGGHATGADSAVVRALGGREAVGGKPERGAIQLEERVLLLDAEDHLLLGVLLRRLGTGDAGVRGVRLVVAGQVHVAQDEDVVATADGVGAGEHGLEFAVARLAGGLVGG